jgi:HSP20 family molecular chaperone IbpA
VGDCGVSKDRSTAGVQLGAPAPAVGVISFAFLLFRGKRSVDVVESEKAYEIKAEMPGMDEKNIEVKVANGNLTIKGEKQEEKRRKKKDYYLQER